MKIKIEFESHTEEIKIIESLFADFECDLGVLDYSENEYKKIQLALLEMEKERSMLTVENILSVKLCYGDSIEFINKDLDLLYKLTYENLVKGLELYTQNESIVYNTDKCDYNDTYNILQYALFDEILY